MSEYKPLMLPEYTKIYEDLKTLIGPLGAQQMEIMLIADDEADMLVFSVIPEKESTIRKFVKDFCERRGRPYTWDVNPSTSLSTVVLGIRFNDL